MEISLTNLPLLVLACTDMGGMPGMVNDFPTDAEKLIFLQEPLVTKAIQVYFQFLPITALSVFEVEWLHSVDFITPWHENRNRLTDLYLDLVCSGDTDHNQSALARYMSEMIPIKIQTQAQQLKLIEQAFGDPELLNSGKLPSRSPLTRAGRDLYYTSEKHVWRTTEFAKLSGLIKSQQWSRVKEHLYELKVYKPQRLGAVASILDVLAETGHIEPLSIFLSLSSRMEEQWRKDCILAAIRYDHVDLLVWLLENPSPLPHNQRWTIDWVQHAVSHGSIKCLARFGPFFPGIIREMREEPPLVFDVREPQTLRWLMPQNFFGISEQYWAFACLVHHRLEDDADLDPNPLDLIGGHDAELLDIWFTQSDLNQSEMLDVMWMGGTFMACVVPWRMLCRMIVKYKVYPAKLLKLVPRNNPDDQMFHELCIFSSWLHNLPECSQ